MGNFVRDEQNHGHHELSFFLNTLQTELQTAID